MRHLNVLRQLAARPVHAHREGLPRRKVAQAKNVHAVRARHLVIVLGVHKHEGEHALLLQVGLVDAGKGLDNDGGAAKVAGLQRRVLTRGPLAIVLIADNHPGDARRLVRARNVGHLARGAVKLRLHSVDGASVSVLRANEH